MLSFHDCLLEQEVEDNEEDDSSDEEIGAVVWFTFRWLVRQTHLFCRRGWSTVRTVGYT